MNTERRTECFYNYMYLPMVFVNCYGNWTPVKGTIVDVQDIVQCMMHYDVTLHLVFVYIEMNCASLPVVLVFEAEQSSWIVSWGCGRMRVESIYLLGSRPVLRVMKEGVDWVCFQLTSYWANKYTLYIGTLVKRQWTVLWVRSRNYCRLIVETALCTYYNTIQLHWKGEGVVYWCSGQLSPYHPPDSNKRWLCVYLAVDSLWPYSLHSYTRGPADECVR